MSTQASGDDQPATTVAPLRFFDSATAERLIAEVLRIATDRGVAVATRVTVGRHIVRHAAMDGMTADNDEWLRRKTNTAQRFASSSLEVAQRLSWPSAAHEGGLDPLEFALAGGAIPVDVVGAPAYAILAVSGLASADDHAIAHQALSLVARWQQD